MIRGQVGVLASLALIVVSFSGCFGDDGGAPAGSEATQVPADTTNETLVASIKVLVEGNVTEPVNGSIPAVVGDNLTFDGSDSSGTNLSYAWDFGDGSTGSEPSAVHAFAAAGLFNVTLTVSAGNNTASASVAVNVTAGGPAPGSLVYTHKPAPFTGTMTLGNPNSCSQNANAALSAVGDCKDHKLSITGATPDGTTAMAKAIRIRFSSSSPGAVQVTIYWLGPTGTQIKTTAGAAGSSGSLSLDYAGDMPAGDYTVRMRLNAGANAAYSTTAQVDYFAV